MPNTRSTNAVRLEFENNGLDIEGLAMDGRQALPAEWPQGKARTRSSATCCAPAEIPLTASTSEGT